MSVVSDLIRDMELWKPQREGLEVLDRILTISQIGRGITKKQTLGTLMLAEPTPSYAFQQGLFDFQEEINPRIGTQFPSFCFDICTGGGKTKLMGACIAYLYFTKGFKNFFLLSKGQTIYDKHRLDDFNPASPKYVFKGISNFPTPRLTDGDNYERAAYAELFVDDLTLYLFNIEKIFNERTDVEFRFHRFNEHLGNSFAQLLRDKPDLVFLMDESHNIRAEQSLKAINSLQPILGLEFTATPKAKNVIYSYSLRQGINDGLVKRPVVVTRRDEDALAEEREDIKLADGIRRHERKKAMLETYCKNNGLPVVTPRVLISTQNIAHCEAIAEKIQGDGFLDGRYKGKVLDIHSGSDDEQIEKLLNLEKSENPYEIVVHVNKLKEGWDVKTIYTIIPLRASVSEILTLQTMGRGLRLPFGKPVSRVESLSEEERRELAEIDTLEIISHEKYSAVLAKANEVLDAVGVTTDDRVELESIEIKLDGDKKYDLKIPKIQTKFHSEEELDLRGIKPNFEQLQDVDIKLIGTDLATLQDQDFERIKTEFHGSLVNFFVRIILENSDEFDIRDKADLQKFVKAYLDQVHIADGDKDEVIFKHRGKIATDMLRQVHEKMEATTKIAYEVTDRQIEFHNYSRNFRKGYEEKRKDAVVEADLVHNIIGGYLKSLFSRNIFDSKQEKWLADILDKDADIERWVRPPMGQMTIAYKGGGYNPDFVVETKDKKFFVVEVKADDDIKNDQSVLQKAQAAITWCKTMSQATKQKWEYKLIPHSAVAPTESFKGVISNSVRIE